MNRREERSLLDTARWISALTVAVTHATAIVLRSNGSYLDRIYTNLGHCAVVIFFVLSGYLVGGGVLARRNELRLGSYAVARFSRIYIVLIPALLLTAGLDGLASLIDPQNPLYASIWPSAILGEQPPFSRYGPMEIAGAVLSLETVVSQPMGTAVPLWSLGLEWVFYFLFPAVVLAANALALRTASRPGLVIGILVLAIGNLLLLAHRTNLAPLWLIWTAGAAAYVAAERGRTPGLVRWLGAPICIAGVILSPALGHRYADLLIGLGFAMFLSAFPKEESGLNAGFDRRMAGGSFSLYVTHVPVLVFVAFLFNRAGWLTIDRLPLGLRSVVVLVAMALAIGIVTVGFHSLFEARTDTFRAWLCKRLRVKSPTRAPLREPVA